jgi:UDP-glucose 4-epimerase
MANYGCNRIVYSSSATVYGTPPIIPIPETTRLQADSPYGKTKVMAETIIDDLCHGKAFFRIPLESCRLYQSPADKTWRAISLRYFK